MIHEYIIHGCAAININQFENGSNLLGLLLLCIAFSIVKSETPLRGYWMMTLQ